MPATFRQHPRALRAFALVLAVAAMIAGGAALRGRVGAGASHDAREPVGQVAVAAQTTAAAQPVAPRTCGDDEHLARMFAPALAIAPDDQKPRPVEAFLDRARLIYLDGDRVAEESRVDVARLAALQGNPEAYLRMPPAIDDRQAQSRIYQDVAAAEGAGRYAVTAYARVHCAATTAGMGENTVIQYWLFYLYNDAINVHEGDWELVQVVLDANRRPAYAAYAQHNTYSWRPWDAVLTDPRDTDGNGEPEEHPRVYVARGSHASYFQYAPAGYGGDRVSDTAEFLIPTVRLLPGPDSQEPGFAWLRFSGKWGNVPGGIACKGCDSGPVGPVYNSNGVKWKTPLQWAGQSLTRDDLIAHRTARVTVTGQVRTQVYDEQNRHTGPLPTGRIELGIPGVAHITRAGSLQTTVLLPGFTDTTPGRVECEGGEIKSLRVLIPGDPSGRDLLFPRIELGARGVARLQLGRATRVLEVDADGDGVFERTVSPLPQVTVPQGTGPLRGRQMLPLP